jgi:hypothetical protein
VTTVILSAVVPTLIATTFFEPRVRAAIELEEIDAAEEIDAGPFRTRPDDPSPSGDDARSAVVRMPTSRVSLRASSPSDWRA